MAIEMLVGLNVTDEESYESYRRAVAPLLARYSAEIVYDFRIKEVLKAAVTSPINRVFTICFPREELREAFFANTDYIGIKERFFDPAVSHTTIIGTYETET
jgi:uncharacterized protein (DUF1330 family)